MHVISMTAQGVMRLVYMTGHLHVIWAVVLTATTLMRATLAFKHMETHIFLAKWTCERCCSVPTLPKTSGTC